MDKDYIGIIGFYNGIEIGDYYIGVIYLGWLDISQTRSVSTSMHPEQTTTLAHTCAFGVGVLFTHA